MTDSAMSPIEAILRHCEQSAPNPWYPSALVRSTGASRDALDPVLNDLRVAGLIRITDWVPVHGQGYVLTAAGAEALRSPRALQNMRNGRIPKGPGEEPPPNPRALPTDEMRARKEAVLDAFSDRTVPIVSYALLLANIGVFLGGFFLAVQQRVSIDEYLTGASTVEVRQIQEQIGFLSGPDVFIRGQWWRMLTACFAHIGWIHLLVNMYSLYAVGPLMERLWGRTRFLILYLLAGLGGSAGMLLENPTGGGAGASGAIWGIMASLASWLFLHRDILHRRLLDDWRRQLMTVFVLNVFLTFGIPHISKGGHFGGGLVGLVAAFPLDYVRFGNPRQRILAALVLMAIPVACVAIVQVPLGFNTETLEQERLQKLETAYRKLRPEAVAAIQHADRILNQQRPERDQAEVAGVTRDVEQNAAAVDQLAAQFEQAGPQSTPRLESYRNEVLQDLGRLASALKNRRDLLMRQTRAAE
jgi:rhomboid protease GluP